MFKFDELNFTVSWQDSQLTLQPLSYSLLVLLWENANKIVSNQVIYKTLWNDASISPETLKQRVFLLRKALSEAGIECVEIKSVRGEGYRLINSPSFVIKEQKRRAKIKWAKLLFGFTIITLILWLIKPQQDIPVNNRLVIWSNSNSSEQNNKLNVVKQVIKTTVLSEPFKGKIQFIESRFDKAVPLHTQARKNRAGLVILLEMANEAKMRAQLIEPITATVLLSISMELNEQYASKQSYKLIEASERLFISGKLVLTKQMRNNSSHPIWMELSMIAHEKD